MKKRIPDTHWIKCMYCRESIRGKEAYVYDVPNDYPLIRFDVCKGNCLARLERDIKHLLQEIQKDQEEE